MSTDSRDRRSRRNRARHDTPLRVVTLNVHGWTDASAQSNAERVAALLRHHRPALVGLQEVLATPMDAPGPRTTTLGWLARELDYEHTGVLRQGCGLLSSFPLTRCDLLDRPPRRRGGGHDRQVHRAIGCRVEHPDGPLDVVVVHLNHVDASRRLQQLDRVLAAYPARASETEPQTPGLWLGDFNALCPADYDSKQWSEIAATRARNRWEAPRGDIVARLDALGMVDSWRATGSRGPRSTCRFGTRIDYVWATPAFARAWRVLSCRTIPWDGSDHDPVIAEFLRET